VRDSVPLSGATEVVGVIGSPIRHSLSPALFNAAFAELVGADRTAYRATREAVAVSYRFQSGGRPLHARELPLMRALRGESVAGMRVEVVRVRELVFETASVIT